MKNNIQAKRENNEISFIDYLFIDEEAKKLMTKLNEEGRVRPFEINFIHKLPVKKQESFQSNSSTLKLFIMNCNNLKNDYLIECKKGKIIFQYENTNNQLEIICDEIVTEEISSKFIEHEGKYQLTVEEIVDNCLIPFKIEDQYGNKFDFSLVYDVYSRAIIYVAGWPVSKNNKLEQISKIIGFTLMNKAIEDTYSRDYQQNEELFKN